MRAQETVTTAAHPWLPETFMRYMTIPPNVAVADLPHVQGDTLSFHSCFLELVAPRFPVAEVAQVEILRSTADKIGATEVAGVVELTDAEHTALQMALPEVKGALLIRLLAFYSAVAGAAEKRPQ